MATAPGNHGEDVAAQAELRWAVFVMVVIGLLLVMIAFASLHWVMMPARRVETINPTTLHLTGEFVEDNLGSAVEPDGSVTVRLVGQQYSFVPQCIVVPDNTPVRFRGTSADVIHGFIIADTNVNVMLEPGYISTFQARFRKPGMHVMPCHEFCSVGHAGMWARVKVIDRDSFFKQAQTERRQSCVQQ
ncbi:cupredoxin domain-containing protein [Noviherbaspirillum autotrophicum]|uniref:Cytochrome c oxidase subunit II n=1 Tax=Noviherbaspirillum autotrophicum TaxID=709839 RepID=A0A0C2BNF4_9BURK|nr:cytochrome c oxidase subunit II [Noviherbaspirillum autotrophicum]KIF81559.1 cytochrome c oxidase subunit II [Noviherbaspirillum autotrophicum]